MGKFRVPVSRNQISLFPASVEDYVGEEDGVRFVDSLVDEFDLSVIETRYSSFGRPGYDPRMLVKLLVYGTIRGIRSSRELSRATKENVRFIFLANNEKPDFRTINRFRKDFAQELSALLKQTVRIGLKEELITLESVAIDGTRLRAFAGKNSFKHPEKLEEELKRLDEALEKALAAGLAADTDEDEEHGDDDGDFKLPPTLQGKKERAERIRQALKEYEENEGKKPNKISTTDPESRFLRGRGIEPGFNAQASVDTDSGMVVGGYVTNAGNDQGELNKNVESIVSNTGEEPAEVVADSGYVNFKELAELEERGIKGYVPIPEKRPGFSLKKFRYNPQTDSYTCPAGKELKRKNRDDERERTNYMRSNCGACKLRNQCIPDAEGIGRLLAVSDYEHIAETIRKRMKSNHAQDMLKLRRCFVERLFGHIKYNRKLSQLLFRTKKRVEQVWNFELAVFNVEVLIKHRAVAH